MNGKTEQQLFGAFYNALRDMATVGTDIAPDVIVPWDDLTEQRQLIFACEVVGLTVIKPLIHTMIVVNKGDI